MAKIMEIISKETGGKSYNTEKYSYDTIGMPSFCSGSSLTAMERLILP